jgi:hypothetical protein
VLKSENADEPKAKKPLISERRELQIHAASYYLQNEKNLKDMETNPCDRDEPLQVLCSLRKYKEEI